GGRVAVCRVDGRRVARVVGLVLLVPGLAVAGQLVGPDRTEGEIGPVAGRADAVVPRLLEHAVAGHDRDVGEGGPDVLPELSGVLAGDRADVDDVRPGRLDLLGQGAVVGRLGVEALGGAVRVQNRAADLGEPKSEGPGETLAVDLRVVEDVGLGLAEALGPFGARRALRVVGADDPGVAPVALRVVRVRLTRLGDAVDDLRQARIGVGRRDHHE